MTPYWPLIKLGAVLVAIVLAFRWAYGLGYDAAELKHLKAEQAVLDAAVERHRGLQKKLDALPRSEDRIREVVRENPATCERPVPVADSLREAIRAANAARAVPANS